jgi:hypothetical protein
MLMRGANQCFALDREGAKIGEIVLAGAGSAGWIPLAGSDSRVFHPHSYPLKTPIAGPTAYCAARRSPGPAPILRYGLT